MPVLTAVIGAPGSGKAVWCEDNRRFLALPFYEAAPSDAASPSFNDPGYLASARAALDASIERRIELGEDFGICADYSDTSRPALMRRAAARGFSVSGVFLATSSPNVNFRRISERRNDSNGPPFPYEEAKRTWRASQDNLVATASAFTHLAIFDYSVDGQAVSLARVAGRRVMRESRSIPQWAEALVVRIERRVRDRQPPGLSR